MSDIPANDNHYSHDWAKLTKRDWLLLAAFMIVMALLGGWFGTLGYEDMRVWVEANFNIGK